MREISFTAYVHNEQCNTIVTNQMTHVNELNNRPIMRNLVPQDYTSTTLVIFGITTQTSIFVYTLYSHEFCNGV